MSKATASNTPYKNRQKMQREMLQLATEKGWRVILAKGDQLIVRR